MRTVPFLWSVLVTVVWPPVSAGVSNLLGFRCGDRKSSVTIASYNTLVGDLCPDLEILFSHHDPQTDDEATVIIVEAGDSILPGQGTELLRGNLPPADNFMADLRQINLQPLSESDETCGVFYLHAYLSNDRSQVLEFETLKVVKPCRDNPGLSLRVERTSGNVRQSALYPGTQNPFRAIGVSSVSVANIADNCTQDTGACNQTAVQSRRNGEVPDVVAFFIPLSWRDTMPDDRDSFMNRFNFSNVTGDTWYMEEPGAYRSLIKLGLQDMNMFHNSIMLHNQTLLDADMNAGFQIGQTLGSLDLEKTRMPDGLHWQGLLVVALDPLNKFGDVDRSDNIFVQYVSINISSAYDLMMYGYGYELGDCSVTPSLKNRGTSAYISYLSYFDDSKVFLYNSKFNGVKQAWGRPANKAAAVAHVAKLKLSRISQQCLALERSFRRKSLSENFVIKRVGKIVKNITDNFRNNINSEVQTEGEQISLVLSTASELLDTVMENKNILKMIERLVKKEAGPPPGSDNGFNPPAAGFSPTPHGPFGNGFGSEGSGWSSTTSYPTWNQWNSTEDGFWSSTTSDPSYSSTTTDFCFDEGISCSLHTQCCYGLQCEDSGMGYGVCMATTDSSSTPYPGWSSTTTDLCRYEGMTCSAADALCCFGYSCEDAAGDGNLLCVATDYGSSSTPYPGWSSTTTDYDSTPYPGWSSTTTYYWNDTTPPPFWNSSVDWNNTWWQSTTWGWNSSVPWWQSSTPPSFWNSTFDWNSTYWNETFTNWNSSSEFPSEFPSYDYGAGGPGWEGSGDGDYPYHDYSSGFGPHIPPPPPDISATELEEALNALEPNQVEQLLSSYDQATLWGMYEKLNGTDMGYQIEDHIFDSANDEEADAWGSVLGDFGGFRRKRSIEEMNSEDMPAMMSMGLQGFLIMDGRELEHIFVEIQTCLKEILWESETENRLCSILPTSLKNKIKQIMMLVLKQDVSIAFFNLKDDVGGIMTSIGEQNQDIQSLAQAVMSKAMVPITSTDLSEILRSAKQIWSRVVQANGQVKVLKLVTGLLDSVNDENILSSVAKTVNKVQGMLASGQDLVLLSGEMGPQPDSEQLCEMYTNKMVAEYKDVRRKGGEAAVWLRKGQVVYRGALCPLTGHWFWSRAAGCDCFNYQEEAEQDVCIQE